MGWGWGYVSLTSSCPTSPPRLTAPPHRPASPPRLTASPHRPASPPRQVRDGRLLELDGTKAGPLVVAEGVTDCLRAAIGVIQQRCGIRAGLA